MNEKKKAFDAVQMKQDIQQKLFEKTNHMSDEERSAYHRKLIEKSPLADFWKSIQPKQKRKSAVSE